MQIGWEHRHLVSVDNGSLGAIGRSEICNDHQASSVLASLQTSTYRKLRRLSSTVTKFMEHWCYRVGYCAVTA